LWHGLLSDASFRSLLLTADFELAEEMRGGGCAFCGGALHAAHFLRKPRGGPELPPGHDLRLSFCCAVDGCRKRCTPPSVRFLGRRIYWATVIVIVTVLRHGPTPDRVRKLQQLVGASRRTVERWCAWWRASFVETHLWRATTFIPPIAPIDLPSALLKRFRGDGESRLLALLRFLKPLTGGTNWLRLAEGR
jgi:hypothetical protein